MGFLSSLSFLTPVYIAAGLAVGLPILLHLIRRTPQGRQDFSSVMFLTASPPRITRRSRIEHWLLLLLRALAVLLIVAAFMRPLWRQLQAGESRAAGRLVVLMLDRSASLQRAGLWDEACTVAVQQVEALDAADELTVLTFDKEAHVILDRTESAELGPTQRAAVLRQRLDELSCSWGPTHLDTALITAADQLEQAEAGIEDGRPRSVILVSDLAAGSRWQGLQSFEWPQDVTVELCRIGSDSAPDNAGIAIVGQPQPGHPPFVRLRVSNAANSHTETFQLGWRGTFDDPQTTEPTSGIVPVYVPPGQSRVVRLARDSEDFSSVRAAIAGDAHPFDNQVSLSWPERCQLRVVYRGPDDEFDRDGLRFFLRPLFADTDARVVQIDSLPPGSTDVSDPAQTPAALVIATGPLSDGDGLSDWIENGGTLLYVLRPEDNGTVLAILSGVERVPVTEAEIADYAMLREVDFTHPIFAPLSDPRFSDLSKVHFWKHRRVDVTSWPLARVLARFDDGDPAWIETPVGQGRLLVLTSSWLRSDSELATWSKFVPTMNALLASAAPQEQSVSHTLVGEALPLGSFANRTPAPDRLVWPDGTEQPWSEALSAPTAQLPGLYKVLAAQVPTALPANPTPAPPTLGGIAVNLPPDESQTAPLGVDVWDSLGLKLQGDAVRSADAERLKEQLARNELESRQKLWKYLLAAALLVLLAETLLAGRHAYRDIGPTEAG
ncbi:MAG: BatA domain-containing protein [Planctomycetaceae bacterium]